MSGVKEKLQRLSAAVVGINNMKIDKNASGGSVHLTRTIGIPRCLAPSSGDSQLPVAVYLYVLHNGAASGVGALLFNLLYCLHYGNANIVLLIDINDQH